MTRPVPLNSTIRRMIDWLMNMLILSIMAIFVIFMKTLKNKLLFTFSNTFLESLGIEGVPYSHFKDSQERENRSRIKG